MSSEALEKLSYITNKALPVIRQSEIAECGHSCLAMIASYYGHKTNIAALRQRFPTSSQGLKLKTMVEIAERMGFATRALKCELVGLKNLKLPAVLHWDLNHYVVLKSFSRRKIEIHDPAKGYCVLELEEFSKHFTGIALELTPTNKFKKGNDQIKLPLSNLWSKLSGFGGSIFQILLLSVVLQVYLLAAPQYLQIVVDSVLPAFDENLLLVLAVGFGLFLLINLVADVCRNLVILYAGTSMAYQISVNLFNQLIRLPLPFFERRHVGDIVSRFGSIDAIRSFLTEGVVLGVVDGVMVIATLGLMIAYSPLLATISVLSLLLYLILRLSMFGAFRRASEELIVTKAAENSNFIETVRGMQPIKAFGQEHERMQQWQVLLADSVNQSVRVQHFSIIFSSSQALIRGLEHVLIIYVAAGMVMKAEFTIGMIFAFAAYRTQFVDKTSSLVELAISYRMLGLHLERIADIATAEPEPRDGTSVSVKSGDIEIRDLTFSYEPHLPPIISNGDLKINAGDCVALVGPSGGGKSTLLKLMLGLMSPDSGGVFVDGSPLANVDPNSYRQQIASVMQNDTLFAGSMAENISFFDQDPDFDWIQACAKSVSIHEDIQSMAMGYETPVGDMGSSLSGGQLQRILLARALYKRPKILFIDEATSSLDVPTEKLVLSALGELKITRVMVAHRPDAIRLADRRIFVANGIVAELDKP
ncbi:MAG: peptidase domain-containing ABC transporter [Granulosicoccus sp.]